MNLPISLGDRSYHIVLERGSLSRLEARLAPYQNILVVTDDGVPKQYLDTVLAQCKNGHSHVVAQGEGSKSIETYKEVLSRLLELGFTRKDCVLALGGGVVGDLAGFVAASYMRGIPYIGIPTTTLSQIDSSIGGKVAVNLGGAKNMVGAFYQPGLVVMDPDVFGTLTPRHYQNGLVEALKAGLIGDPDLFALFEENLQDEKLEEVLLRALKVKKAVVEQDETEQGLRAILNFGHTIGHGIEGAYGLGGLYHGECVAIGMLPMIEDPQLRARTEKILRRMGMPLDAQYDPDVVLELMKKDKKSAGDSVAVVKVKTLGQAVLEKISKAELRGLLGEGAR